jgi:hypothetical protein
MLSYQGRRNLFGTLTNTNDSTTLTTADTLMNAAEKRILTMRPWPFLEKKDTTLTTTASTAGYELPQKVSKVYAVTITVGSQLYTPDEISSEEEWNYLNQTTQTSDSVEYYYIRAGRIEFYPRPASSSNTITLYYRQVPKDLSIVDYTTGSIVSIANGATAVVGTGTTFTAAMVGRYLRITDSDTANKGDGFWYEIGTYTSATAIGLLKPYAGTSISAGTAAYTIGQMSLLPEGYHELPVYEAVKTYFSSIQPDRVKFKLFDQMSKEMLVQLVRDFSSKTENVVIEDNFEIKNPNLFISL